MSKEGRKGHTWFGLFLDVRKYGWEGVFKMQNERWKGILRRDEMKKKVRGKENKKDENKNQMGFWN